MTFGLRMFLILEFREPANLVETVKRRFISLGGKVFEAKVVSSIHIYDDAAIVQLTNGEILSSHLIIDSMGNFSPIVKQILQEARWRMSCSWFLLTWFQ